MSSTLERLDRMDGARHDDRRRIAAAEAELRELASHDDARRELDRDRDRRDGRRLMLVSLAIAGSGVAAQVALAIAFRAGG